MFFLYLENFSHRQTKKFAHYDKNPPFSLVKSGIQRLKRGSVSMLTKPAGPARASFSRQVLNPLVLGQGDVIDNSDDYNLPLGEGGREGR